MKKAISILMIVSIVFGLLGCSDTENKKKSQPKPVAKAPYEELLDALTAAFPWNSVDEPIVPEYPELSYMYRRYENLADIGYAFMDLDGNGQEELILTDMDNHFIFDLFTLKDGAPVQLFTSGERYSHRLYQDGYVQNQWSSSAAEGGTDYYRIQDGQLLFLERITLDAYHAIDIGRIPDATEVTDGNCWFHSTTQNKADYQPITYEERQELTAKYSTLELLEIQLTPLSEYRPS